MIFIIIGALVIALIAITQYVKRKGKWNDYKPFKECYGISDWYRKNENTWEREKFDWVVSAVVSVITTILMRLFYFK